MGKKMTKLLTIFLALVLVLGAMSACAETETPEVTKAQEETNEKVEATDEPAAEEEQEMWSGEISVSSYAWAPLVEEDDFVGPVIEETLLDYNIDVDLEYVYVEYPTYQEVMNTRLAGGTAPDIFLSYSLDNMLALYDQGAIASWSKEFYLEHCPTINAFVEQGGLDGMQEDFVDLWWDYSMVGDEMITIAGFHPGGNIPYKNVIYREDWLDALGVAQADLPMTVDGFVDLMYRFANEDPDGNGKKDTYGMSSTMIRALFGAYGNYNGFIESEPQWYDRGDGKLIVGDLFPENKEVLELCAQLYTDGILHPEFITGENEGAYWALSHQMINGEIGVSCLASIDHYRYTEVTGDPGPCLKEYLAVNGEDSSVVYGPWPAGPEGEYGYVIGVGASVGENPIYNAELNNDPEKLGAILDIFDIFARDTELAKWAHWGEEGVTYEIVDNDGTPTVNSLFSQAELNAMGVMSYRSLTGGTGPYNEEILRMNFSNNPANSNRVNIMKQPQYDSYNPGELRVALPSSGDYKQELITYRDETWIKMITGELPIDYWDTFVEEYNARGGAVLTEEANEWYSSK
jgi:putative aldouronate transport system substrate-binding protein